MLLDLRRVHSDVQQPGPDEGQLAIGRRRPYLSFDMLLAFLFVLGVANFAAQKAVIESNHPMLDALPGFYRSGGGRFSIGFEFVILVVAMLLAAHGWPGAATAYGIYSALNLMTAWLVLSGRI